MTMNHIVLYSQTIFVWPIYRLDSCDSWAENLRGAHLSRPRGKKNVRQNPLGRWSGDLRPGICELSFRLLRFPARPIPPIHPSELFLEKKVSNFRKLYSSWDTSNSLNYLRKDELKNNLDLVFSFRTRNKTKIQIGIADSIYKVERSIEFVIITRENKIPITNNCGREKFESAAEWVFLDRTIGFSSLLPDWKWNWTKLYTRRSTKKQDTPWLFHSRGTTA